MQEKLLNHNIINTHREIKSNEAKIEGMKIELEKERIRIAPILAELSNKNEIIINQRMKIQEIGKTMEYFRNMAADKSLSENERRVFTDKLLELHKAMTEL